MSRVTARAGIVSITCFLRSLPLFFRTPPRTPLRVLCIVALDTVHVLRHSRPIPRQRRRELAAFLDFQAWTNAMWDRKPSCAAEYRELQSRLESAGLGVWVTEYLTRVGELETHRPSIGGGLRRFDEVRSYREEVARLSLATLAAVALNAACLEEARRPTHRESDIAMLFRMAMLCQIIDDIIDYRSDLSAGLPSFLTACASLPQALALTAEAARSYATHRMRSSGDDTFPLQAGLGVITMATTLVVRVARIRGTEQR